MIYLKTLYQYQSVTFWDDTFTFRKDWIDRFCDIYEASGIKAKIAACTRADIVCRNEAMVERLAGVGLDWFVIGLESGSQRLLDMIKKGTTVEQNIEAGKICKRHGVKVFGTYMYGLPTETEEDTLATATMIDEIAPEFHSPFWFVPIRGTEIYSMCENMDLILPETNGRTIARTAVYQPTIRDVNYDFIGDVMFRGKRELPLRKAA
jgi:anaerobic magnesium-protoporphyrin IX monomethyl ester cyclase